MKRGSPHYVPDEDVAAIQELARTGLSARAIGAKMRRSRNSIVGIIHRNNGKKRERLPSDTGNPSRVFDEPSAPRRFSWEEHV